MWVASRRQTWAAACWRAGGACAGSVSLQDRRADPETRRRETERKRELAREAQR